MLSFELFLVHCIIFLPNIAFQIFVGNKYISVYICVWIFFKPLEGNLGRRLFLVIVPSEVRATSGANLGRPLF